MVTPELLAACRRGDPKAFEEVVRRTHKNVYTQALRLVGDRQDAEDVAQEAYLRVFRGLAGFRGEAQFETWLYRIVANAAMSYLRRRQRFGAVLAEPEDASSAQWIAPDVQVDEQAVDRDALVKALEALPVSFRTVVVLKDVYGLSCLEISQQLGTTEGAVKVRLHRARKRLKGMLFGPEESRDDV
jgi:RNA polymerase sigma-70 factor, ECF subfamily